MKLILILYFALSIFISCSPLKKVQKNEKVDSVVIDKSVIEKAVQEMLLEKGELVQTTIEYDLPIIIRDTIGDSVVVARHVQPIKKVTHTQIVTQKERLISSDSLVRHDIKIATDRESETKEEEEPPASVQWMRSLAIILGLLLIIIILLKYFKR